MLVGVVLLAGSVVSVSIGVGVAAEQGWSVSSVLVGRDSSLGLENFLDFLRNEAPGATVPWFGVGSGRSILGIVSGNE